MPQLKNFQLPKFGSGDDKKPNGFQIGLVIGILVFFLIMAFSNPEQFRRTLKIGETERLVERYDPPNGKQPAEELCKVDRIVDGDTLIVISDGERVRVRLIGVDTPETVKPGVKPQPYGAEATQYTTNRISAFGNMVVLRSDGDPVDQYGRRLAMVYLGRDGIELLNEELVRHGLAEAKTNYRYSDGMKERFLKAQTEAKQERIGIWSLPSNNQAEQSSSNERSRNADAEKK